MEHHPIEFASYIQDLSSKSLPILEKVQVMSYFCTEMGSLRHDLLNSFFEYSTTTKTSMQLLCIMTGIQGTNQLNQMTTDSKVEICCSESCVDFISSLPPELAVHCVLMCFNPPDVMSATLVWWLVMVVVIVMVLVIAFVMAVFRCWCDGVHLC